jgi:hypothetical protein
VGGEGCKSSCRRKTEPLGPISWTFETLSTARVGKKKKNTSEGSVGITFSNVEVVGVADRVKTLATQGSDGSFSGVREDDILTATLEDQERPSRRWMTAPQ